ncbi:MAG: GNAT family N-acetyltransferase [Oscillatoriophycideae cyanobacterium NC_groundwater_1537_Pr4_S-0.65um_50_18]|nr:GNAT family N-acetyltransferase [Oscillatoriophycideae cyanobacterium NC_groundwater_1537_Pr4_S-0.65um_50_18]
MQLHQLNDIKEFWQQTQNYLMQDEAEHNVLISVLQTLLHYPERYSEQPYLAFVQAEGNILAIAIRTPPHKLLLSKVKDLNALKLIAQDLQRSQLPGVSGLVAEAEAFVQAWQTVTGQPYHREIEMRLHQLTEVKPVATPDGFLRLAVESDRALLIDWFRAFNAEIGMAVSHEAERIVDMRLNQQSIYLWEDGVPVSMAGGRLFSQTVARIAPVYTPPAYRCKRYATACVAVLSQKLLDQGCDRCFLFTDLANPISNHIYHQIGYRPVCDWHEYSLIPTETC